jgi:hypothetical protein|tara:strand:+ start:2039 stop:2308 length:270 start_codon:yes stop_codon:yes gene_type:complete
MKIAILTLLLYTTILTQDSYYIVVTCIYGTNTKKTTISPITKFYKDSLSAEQSIKVKGLTEYKGFFSIISVVAKIKLDSVQHLFLVENK